MQWGAQPVFEEVRRSLAQDPGRPVVISPAWTNGVVNLARFFLPYDVPGVVSGGREALFEPLPIYFGSLPMFLEGGYPIEETFLFVMTVQEYEAALAGGEVEVVRWRRRFPIPTAGPVSILCG